MQDLPEMLLADAVSAGVEAAGTRHPPEANFVLVPLRAGGLGFRGSVACVGGGGGGGQFRFCFRCMERLKKCQAAACQV